MVQIEGIYCETPLVKTFTLRLLSGNGVFLPGQYVRLLTPVKDGSVDARDYSITSSPSHTESFQIAVKKIQGSRATNYLHAQAVVGDSLIFSGPLGQFTYQDGAVDSLVLVAGGIGITPMLSITRFIHERATKLNVDLLYSAQMPSEMAFLQELRDLSDRDPRIRCTFTVTQPGLEIWDGPRGRIDRAMLSATILENYPTFYLCGPDEMLNYLINIINDLGIEESKIKVDRWFG